MNGEEMLGYALHLFVSSRMDMNIASEIGEFLKKASKAKIILDFYYE
jgi:hypothetical protein